MYFSAFLVLPNLRSLFDVNILSHVANPTFKINFKLVSFLESVSDRIKDRIEKNFDIIKQSFKMRLMRALKCDASKGELSLEDVSIPEVILPDDIVIKVGYAGLCGTDLHIMQGEFAVCGSSKVC